MPEGTTLERTQSVVRQIGERLRSVPEVKEFAAFVGIASPMDFNGMVRHYYLRQGPHFADTNEYLERTTTLADYGHRGYLVFGYDDSDCVA